jgi:predicted RNA-binding Zn ribbon-like protein
MSTRDPGKLQHVAGSLCLELANTIPNRRGDTGRDWLIQPGVHIWARSVGLPAINDAADTGRDDLTELRDVIHRVFAPVANKQDPPAEDVDTVTSLHAKGLMTFGYTVSGDGLIGRRWPVEPGTRDRLARIATSAIELLTGEDLTRVRECAGCGWLFVDASRNRSRVWCSMQTCGNRNKARQHHERTRASSRQGT